MFGLKLVFCLIGVAISLPLVNGQARLFLGQFDNYNAFKYHVALLKVLPNHTSKVICGGAIIDGRHILTAAHCVYDEKKSELLVRSGWDVNPEQPHKEGRSYHSVIKIMYPKDYHNLACRHHEHDLAVLKLDKSFDLADDSKYGKVSLPQPESGDFEGREATFTGYGIHAIAKYVNISTGEVIKETPKYPTQLKYMGTRVISNEECKQDAAVVLTKTNLCTQAVNSHGFSCLGDDGGPLVLDGVVIGIRNSHNHECIHNEPEIFTRVSSYLSFINKVLEHEHSYDIVYI